MLEIYLTRHGETEWNQVRKMQGQLDSPLTTLGLEQAQWLKKRLIGKEFTYIYSSPTGRAFRTAEIINKTLKTQLVTDPRLQEIYLGDWQGQLIEDVEKRFPSEHDSFWHHPHEFKIDGAENFTDVRSRGGEFYEDLIKNHGSGKILVVAHAIILKGILNYVQGKDVSEFWSGKHILPTSLTKINVLDNRISLIYVGDTSHHERKMDKGWFVDEDGE